MKDAKGHGSDARGLDSTEQRMADHGSRVLGAIGAMGVAAQHGIPTNHLAAGDEMLTVYHASPRMPTKGNWRKDTYFAGDAQNAMYYAESHHRGKLTVREVQIPKSLLHPQSGSRFQLKAEYPIAKPRSVT